MNYKKTTLLFLTLFIVLATVTAISAASDDTTATNDNTQTATVDSPSTSMSSSSDSGQMSTSSDSSSSSVSTTTSTAKSVDTTQSTSTSPTKTSQDTTSDKVSTDTSSSSSTAKTTQDTTTSQSAKATTDSSQSQDTSNVNDNSNEVNSVKNSTVDSSKTISTATTHDVYNDNIGDYFDLNETNGPLTGMVNEGDTLDIHGTIELHNQSLTINKAVNVISSTNDGLISLDSVAGSYFGEDPGSSFIINNEGAYTNVTGISFYNTQIWVYNTSYVTFDNITVNVIDQRVGSGNGHTSIREGSEYVTIKNSYFYTENNEGSSSIVLGGANYCTIDNNTIIGKGTVGNLVYLTTNNVNTDTSELNQYNNITNNHIIGPDTALGSCYAIALTGHYNLIENNTVDYTGGNGLTIQSGASSITSNNTINNNDFSNTTQVYAYANFTFTNNKLSKISASANNVTFINNTFVSTNSSTFSATNYTFINNTFNQANSISGNYAIAIGNVFNSNVTFSGQYGNYINNTFESTAILSGNFMNVSGNTFNKNVTLSNNYKNFTGNTFNQHILMSGSYFNFIDNFVYSDATYSINVTGSYNNITDNYLVTDTDAGDDSVVTTGSGNTIENNGPIAVIVCINMDELTYNQENNIVFTLTNKTGETILDDGIGNITIGDYTTTVNVVNGVATLNYIPEETGEFDLIFNYYSNDLNYQNKTETIPITIISNPDRTYYVTNYEELVEAVDTINSIGVDNDYHIELQANDDPTAYDITETINWGTGAVKSLTIRANNQTINGNEEYQFIKVNNGYNLRLENIIIENCISSSQAGTISNNGTLTIVNSTISNSKASDAGVIYNYENADLTITNCILSENTATNNGGVIYNYYGNLKIADSQLTNNSAEYGGVIYNYEGNIEVTDSTITDNTATQNGATIYTQTTNKDIIITGNTFTDNNAPSQDTIYTTEAVQLTDNTFILTEQTVYEGDTIKLVSPILDTSLSSSEKVIYTITDSTSSESIEVTKNSDNIVELEYTFATIAGTDVTINYESTYTNNNITGFVYVKTLDSTIYVTCYEELVEAVESIKSKTVDQNYTIILQDNDDPEAYYLTETISWGTGVVTNLTIDGNGQTINGQESNFIEVAQNYYLNLTNITITNCTSSGRGAVYGNYSTIKITDSKFIDNHGTDGGAIYSNRANITVTNTIFINNTASTGGGAIYSYGPCRLELSNLVFINNTATSYGGGVYAGTVNTTAEYLLFINNTSTTGAGALYNSANMTAAHMIFINNSLNGSSGTGGAMYTSTRANITYAYFENNTAVTGGAIYCSGEQIYDHLYFVNNNASEGGAIYKFANELYITDSTFIENTATNYGGAIYSNNGLTTISQTSFTENSAPYGGALYLKVNNTITDTNFTENTATNSGGAIYVYNTANLTLSNSNLINNTAPTGTAIYFGYTSSANNYLNLENNNIFSSTSGYIDDETTLTSPIYYEKLSTNPEEVTITINDDTQTVTANSGSVSIEYIFTDIGETPATFTYPSFGNTNNIGVIAIIEGTSSIRIESITGTVGDEVTLIAQVITGKEAATDGYVVFKVNGKTIKDEEGNVIKCYVKDGVAECTYTIPYTLSNTYEITAVYYSDEYGVIRTTTNSTITVTGKIANIDLSTNDVLKAGQTVTLKALITDENGNIVTSGKVVFKLNGVSLRDAEGNVMYAYVDENGYATLEYTIPDNYSAKDYLLTAVFQANGFERSETNMTITLTKTDTKIVIDESLLTLSAKSDDTTSKNSITNDVTTYDETSDVTTYADTTEGSDGTITITQGENLQLKATIIDQETGEAVTGTTKVAVKFNEKTVLQQYVTGGVIDVTLYTSSFRNPIYTITIIAGENSQYNQSSFNGTLVVATKD